MVVSSGVIRVALALTTLFSLLAAAAQAGSYDGAALLAFTLPPPGCAVPCWQHIRPGATPSREAVEQLRAHPWVGRVHTQLSSLNDDGWVTWDWSGAQPDFSGPGADRLSTDYGIVRSLTIRSAITFGDLWLALGAPAWVVQHRGDHAMSLEAVFPDLALAAWIDWRCGGRASAIWRAPVTLVWYSWRPQPGTAPGSQAALAQCKGANP